MHAIARLSWKALLDASPELKESSKYPLFHALVSSYDRIEIWGILWKFLVLYLNHFVDFRIYEMYSQKN